MEMRYTTHGRDAASGGSSCPKGKRILRRDARNKPTGVKIISRIKSWMLRREIFPVPIKPFSECGYLEKV
jgi:hypothetical protein